MLSGQLLRHVTKIILCDKDQKSIHHQNWEYMKSSGKYL